MSKQGKSGGKGNGHGFPSAKPKAQTFAEKNGLPIEFSKLKELKRPFSNKPDPDIYEWKDVMYTACLQVVGNSAIIFKTNDWPVYEQPVRPTDAELTPPPGGTDVGGIRAKQYSSALDAVAKLIANEKTLQRPKLYAILKTCIPLVYMNDIEATEGFDKQVDQAQDARELLRRFNKLADYDDFDPTVAMFSLRTTYNEAIKQKKDESLAVYYKRVKVVLQTCEDSNVEIVPPEQVAMDFIAGADAEKYCKCKVDLENQVRAKLTTWPKTLSAAYSHLMTYVVAEAKASASQPAAEVSGSVFFTGAAPKISYKDKKRQKKKDAKKQKSGEKADDAPKTSSAPTGNKSEGEKDGKKPREWPPCPLCVQVL